MFKCLTQQYRVGDRGPGGVFCVKVADFGLSRDIYTKSYYKTDDTDRPLPLKWMAPESLDKRIFTSRSDVVGFVFTRPKRNTPVA
jgi:hypothetical protein